MMLALTGKPIVPSLRSPAQRALLSLLGALSQRAALTALRRAFRMQRRHVDDVGPVVALARRLDIPALRRAWISRGSPR